MRRKTKRATFSLTCKEKKQWQELILETLQNNNVFKVLRKILPSSHFIQILNIFVQNFLVYLFSSD